MANRPAAPKPPGTADTFVRKLPKGKTPEQDLADMTVEGMALNTVVTREWTAGHFAKRDQLGITEMHVAMVEASERLHGGSLLDAEALLLSQAVSLNAVYTTLAKRAHATKYLEHFEKYLRLALKAQSQCRATCETLAVLKNPPVFAKQANIANGPQQVNNGGPVLNGNPARAELPASAPSKLLEAHGERLDGHTEGAAVSGDPALAAVGEVHGAADAGREGARIPERVARR